MNRAYPQPFGSKKELPANGRFMPPNVGGEASAVATFR
jgi:hypothetical protein